MAYLSAECTPGFGGSELNATNPRPDFIASKMEGGVCVSLEQAQIKNNNINNKKHPDAPLSAAVSMWAVQWSIQRALLSTQ